MTESLEARDDAATRTATSDGDVATIAVPAAAASIGRFAVLGAVGAGGMGQVFSAYDPQLDRRVALKLLHGHGDSVDRARLVREAQALARLAHPNVVAVHEVGAHAGQVFVAMEFVEGTTLREWMDAHPAVAGSASRCARALEILLDAGRGIQAAHAAGLVHRDVKPRNILVGSDGRVRVVDFGLARSGVGDREELAATARDDPPDPQEASHDERSGSGTLLAAPLTQTGKVVGTPAYMAPEQFRRGPVDPAADQFAFCVTAWEVLFGARPFAGTTMAMLMAIREGQINRPAGIEVPVALEAALRRGLSHRPSRRHADMATLLRVFDEELAAAKGEARRSRGSGRGWWIAGGVGVIATAGAFWLGGREAMRCDGAAEHFVGVWDSTRKAEIRAAVLGSGATFADGTWTRLETNVDGWRAAWEAGHRDACEAARVRGEQSEHLMDLRMTCLDSRRQRLGAYLDLLAAPTVEVLANAEEGFATLPGIESCGDADYVQHRGQRSEDPELAEIEDEVLAAVSRAASLEKAGDSEAALAIAEAAVVRAAGSELARAHALLAKGRALARVRPREAAELLEEAYGLARAADVGDVAAGAATELARTMGLRLWSAAEAKVWLGLARAEAERLTNPMPVALVDILEGDLLASLGDSAGAQRALDRAFDTLEAIGADTTIEYAQALKVRSGVNGSNRGVADATAALELIVDVLGPDHPGISGYHRALSRALIAEGDVEAALTQAERGLEISESAYGPNSERISADLSQYAEVQLQSSRGGPVAALASLQRAIALYPEHIEESTQLAEFYRLKGRLLIEQGDLGAAVHAYRESYSIHRQRHGDRHAATARVMLELGNAERRFGLRSEGAARMRLGFALIEEIVATQHPAVLEVLDNLASDAQNDGRFEDAYELHLRTRAVARDSFGPSGLPHFLVEVNLCATAQGMGRIELAMAHCETALELAHTGDSKNPAYLANVENTLGSVLVSADRHDEALPRFERAKELWSISLGEASAPVAVALANIAEVRLLQGSFGEARTLYARSLEMRTALNGERHESLVTPLLGISSAALALGESAPSRQAAERALGIAEEAGADPRLVARASEALALALAKSPSTRAERVRARALMQQAFEAFEPIGPSTAADVERVRAWLDAH